MSNERRPSPSNRFGPRDQRDSRGPRGPREQRDREPRPRRDPPSAREIVLEALTRVDDGAFANLVLPELFRRIEAPEAGFAPLDHREKAFATELLYGTVRMRRACDWVVSRFLEREADGDTERCLHMGAYQVVFLGTPPHAAVAATVSAAPLRSQGFVNAVLRRVAAEHQELVARGRTYDWPSIAVELSYPDWIVATLERDLGEEVAHDALRRMNEAATVYRRADGYTQDPASQMVAASVGAREGERILDMCAAPGGKATAMANEGAHIVAVDLHEHRCKLITDNATQLGLTDRIEVHCLDATQLPVELRDFDRVLVDAPCSGLGSLRRRPDARWRIAIDDVAELVALQRALLRSAAAAVRDGGIVVYSVCTLTDAETVGIDRWVAEELPMLRPLPALSDDGWVPHGTGARLLPGETDGMCVFRYEKVALPTP